jgi:hypothetical protein
MLGKDVIPLRNKIRDLKGKVPPGIKARGFGVYPERSGVHTFFLPVEKYWFSISTINAAVRAAYLIAISLTTVFSDVCIAPTIDEK